MRCLICREAPLLDDFTSIRFGRGEIQLVISRVPAHLCPGCGEAYVDEDVATRLLRIAEAVSKSGMREVRCEYGTAEV
jgi:YgiT-type zinc finger domain-containing protein